jgi:hypothetical protein
LPRKKIAADDSEIRVGHPRIRILPLYMVEGIGEVGDELDLLAFIRAESEDLVHAKIPVLIPEAVHLPHSSVAVAESLRLRKTAGVEPFRIGVRIRLPMAHIICAATGPVLLLEGEMLLKEPEHIHHAIDDLVHHEFLSE